MSKKHVPGEQESALATMPRQIALRHRPTCGRRRNNDWRHSRLTVGGVDVLVAISAVAAAIHHGDGSDRDVLSVFGTSALTSPGFGRHPCLGRASRSRSASFSGEGPRREACQRAAPRRPTGCRERSRHAHVPR